MRALATILVLASAALQPANGHVLTNGRVTLTISDPSTGFSGRDGDRVDGASWIDSAGQPTPNLVSNAVRGPFDCGDPGEYWGQALGYPNELAAPMLVRGGETSVYHPNGTARALITTHVAGCGGAAAAAPASTSYILNTATGTINSVKIVRSFGFGAGTPAFANTGLRPYMPRLPLSLYPAVLLPNAAGTVMRYDARACGNGCAVTDWNGRWLADDTGHGSGVMLIRSTSSTAPAQAVIDNDYFSASNVSSIVLLQPQGGWTAPVTEVEYLCFYDARSWTPRDRANGALPAGCRVQ